MPWFFKISRFFNFDGRLPETARALNIGNSVKTFGPRSSIINWSLSNFRFKFQSRKIVKCEKSWHKLFWIVRVRNLWQIFQLKCMIEKSRPVLLTFSTAFYDLSVLRNLFSKAEIRQFGVSGFEGLSPFSLKSRSYSHNLSTRVTENQSRICVGDNNYIY